MTITTILKFSSVTILFTFIAVVISLILLVPTIRAEEIAPPETEGRIESCGSTFGFEVVEGIGSSITDENTDHTISIKITDQNKAHLLPKIRMEIFFGTAVGATNMRKYEWIDLKQYTNNQLIEFKIARPAGGISPSDYRYVYFYQKAANPLEWGIQLGNPELCYLGNYSTVPQEEIDPPASSPPTTPPTSQPPPPTNPPEGSLSCGQIVSLSTAACSCQYANNTLKPFSPAGTGFCCGQIKDNLCYGSAEDLMFGVGGTASPLNAPPVPPPNNNPPPATGGEGDEGDEATPPSIFDTGLTSATFKELNPLAKSKVGDRLSSPGGIIGRVLQFAFPLAGLILFAMIVWGGFEMLTGAASSKGMDAGKQRVTNAIIGFIILFSSYWIIQIVQAVFGIAIL